VWLAVGPIAIALLIYVAFGIRKRREESFQLWRS